MLKAASALFQSVGNLMIIVGKEFGNLATSISLENNQIASSKKATEPTQTSIRNANSREQDQDIYIYEEDEDSGEIIEIWTLFMTL